MSNYIVSFHPSLNHQQIQELLSAIRLFQGVASVGKVGDISAGVSDDLLNMDFSDKNSQNNGQKPNFMAQNIAPPNVNPMGYASTPNSAYSNIAAPINQPATTQQADEQRTVITKIIKWGIHNKKISMQQLESSSAEGTIGIAKKLIELMPNPDRERILKG